MLCIDKVNIIIFYQLNFGNTFNLLQIQVRWYLRFLHLQKQTGKRHKMLEAHEIWMWQVKNIYCFLSYLHGYSFPIILFYVITNHLWKSIISLKPIRKCCKFCEKENDSFQDIRPLASCLSHELRTSMANPSEHSHWFIPSKSQILSYYLYIRKLQQLSKKKAQTFNPKRTVL